MRIVLISLAVLALSTGCNKKLKKEIEEMDQKIQELESKQNQTSHLLGSDEPISLSFYTSVNTNKTINLDQNFYFKAGNFNTQYLEDNGDGTYEVYIERWEDLNGNSYSFIEFDYNPSTNVATNVELGGEFYDSNGTFCDTRIRSTDPEATINVSVQSFNANTGTVSVTATGSTSNSSNYNYFAGNGMSGTWKFSGKLPIYKQ